MAGSMFDALMNAHATIMRPGAPAGNYNVKRTLTAVLTDWPCRVSDLGPDTQYNQNTQAAIATHKIFGRPPAVSPPLNEHDWIYVGDNQYNIVAAGNPSQMNHHLELIVKLVTP